MLISDVMNTNVVSIPSTTSLAEARKIMDAHNIRRLPIIDNLKLVGVINKDSLDKMGPSQLTTFSVHEMVYMLNKITVAQIMRRDVTTVPPTATIEESVALAQQKKIGFLVVMDGERVIGVATTNDIFRGILNPLLGIGLPGSRIIVINCNKGPDIEKVIGAINRRNVNITNLFISDFPAANKRDLFIHLDTEDPAPIVEDILKIGFKAATHRR
jgi:acetoin utilization protein AcuB